MREPSAKPAAPSFTLSEAFAKGGEGAAALARKVVEDDRQRTRLTNAQHHVRTQRLYRRENYQGSAAPSTARADIELSLNWPSRSIARYDGLGLRRISRFASPKPSTRSPTTPSAWAPPPAGRSTSQTLPFRPVPASSSSPPATMMLMPGLPKVSRALAIDVDEHGEITGMQ